MDQSWRFSPDQINIKRRTEVSIERHTVPTGPLPQPDIQVARLPAGLRVGQIQSRMARKVSSQLTWITHPSEERLAGTIQSSENATPDLGADTPRQDGQIAPLLESGGRGYPQSREGDQRPCGGGE